MNFLITVFITDGTSNNSCYLPMEVNEENFEQAFKEQLLSLREPLKHSYLIIQCFYMSALVSEIKGTIHQILPELHLFTLSTLKEMRFMKDEVIKGNTFMNE